MGLEGGGGGVDVVWGGVGYGGFFGSDGGVSMWWVVFGYILLGRMMVWLVLLGG